MSYEKRHGQIMVNLKEWNPQKFYETIGVLRLAFNEYAGAEITIEELKNGNLVSQNDPQGNPYTYKLVSKESGMEVVPEKSLFNLGVQDGNTLLLMPTIVAGQGLLFL